MRLEADTERERKLWCKAWRTLLKHGTEAERVLRAEYAALHPKADESVEAELREVLGAIRQLRD